jgi:hypothetical protein
MPVHFLTEPRAISLSPNQKLDVAWTLPEWTWPGPRTGILVFS